jgi:hypothetical protein
MQSRQNLSDNNIDSAITPCVSFESTGTLFSFPCAICSTTHRTGNQGLPEFDSTLRNEFTRKHQFAGSKGRHAGIFEIVVKK